MVGDTLKYVCYFKKKFIRNLKCRLCAQNLSLIHNIYVTNLLRRRCFAALGHERLLVACVCVCVCVSCSIVSDSAIQWAVVCQALLSMGFSRQEYWSELPCSSPGAS